MADVSIIIVSWNARELLLKCLESIPEGLGELEAEVIVVDNASTDGSAEGVRDLHPGVKLLVQSQNLGFAKANNIGIKESAAKYVCLINSDVVVLSKCIERLFFFLEDNPMAAIAAPRILNPDMTLQASCRRFPSLPGTLLASLGLDRLNYFPHDRTRSVEAVRRLQLLSCPCRVLCRDAQGQYKILAEAQRSISQGALYHVGPLSPIHAAHSVGCPIRAQAEAQSNVGAQGKKKRGMPQMAHNRRKGGIKARWRTCQE